MDERLRYSSLGGPPVRMNSSLRATARSRSSGWTRSAQTP